MCPFLCRFVGLCVCLVIYFLREGASTDRCVFVCVFFYVDVGVVAAKSRFLGDRPRIDIHIMCVDCGIVGGSPRSLVSLRWGVRRFKGVSQPTEQTQSRTTICYYEHIRLAHTDRHTARVWCIPQAPLPKLHNNASPHLHCLRYICICIYIFVCNVFRECIHVSCVGTLWHLCNRTQFTLIAVFGWIGGR